MAQPFDSQQDLNSRQRNAIIESTQIPGQAGHVVIGPDGGPVAIASQDQTIIDSMEVTTSWTGSADVTGIATSTNHRQGQFSLSFDKSGVTVAIGSISKTYTALNLSRFDEGIVKYRYNFTAGLGGITNIELRIGQDAANNNIYRTVVASLATGWNEIEILTENPTAVNGVGTNWNAVTYVEIRVNLTGAGSTSAGILIDQIECYNKERVVLGTDIDFSGQQTMANSFPAVIASDQSAIPTVPGAGATPLTPTSGQAVVGAGPTQAPLSAAPAVAAEAVVIANLTNANNIFLGATGVTGATGLIMEPGRSAILRDVDLNVVFINGTATQGVSWFRLR